MQPIPSKVGNRCLRDDGGILKREGGPAGHAKRGKPGAWNPEADGAPRILVRPGRTAAAGSGRGGAGRCGAVRGARGRVRGRARAPTAKSEPPPCSPDAAALGRGPPPALPAGPGPLMRLSAVPGPRRPRAHSVGPGSTRVSVLQINYINSARARPLQREAAGDPGPSEKPPSRLGSEGGQVKGEGTREGAEPPSPLRGPETREPQERRAPRESGGRRRRGRGSAPRSWKGPRGQTRPARGQTGPGRRRDLPSVLGSGSDPEGAGGGAGSAPSPSAVALPFPPGGWGSLRGAPPPGRAGGNERGRCTPTRVGEDPQALLFPKAPLPPQRGGVRHSCQRKDFCVSTEVSRNHCFFSRWLHPLPSRFLLICCSPACRARSWPGWRSGLEPRRLTPAPGPQLRGPLTALAERP